MAGQSQELRSRDRLAGTGARIAALRDDREGSDMASKTKKKAAPKKKAAHHHIAVPKSEDAKLRSEEHTSELQSP